LTPLDIDACYRLLPGHDLALHELEPVAVEPRQRVGGVEDARFAGLGREPAGVADLAAALGVERCAVEEETVTHDREHTSLALGLLITGELGGAELLDDLAVFLEGLAVAFDALARILAPAPLLGHRRLEAGEVDFDTSLRRDLAREVDREPERVVQPERHVAGDDARAFVELGVEDVGTRLERLPEAFL